MLDIMLDWQKANNDEFINVKSGAFWEDVEMKSDSFSLSFPLTHSLLVCMKK